MCPYVDFVSILLTNFLGSRNGHTDEKNQFIFTHLSLLSLIKHTKSVMVSVQML